MDDRLATRKRGAKRAGEPPRPKIHRPLNREMMTMAWGQLALKKHCCWRSDLLKVFDVQDDVTVELPVR